MDVTRITPQVHHKADAGDLLTEVGTMQPMVEALQASQGRRAREGHALFGRTILGRLGRAGLAVSLLSLALCTNAFASVPDSSGVIHGCYLKNFGVLRAIDTDTGQHCFQSEAALTWNRTGPQGAAGATGPAGPKGDAGA